jgi:uncharacterized membrane-anchored protein YjiN (DUF445 family)
MNAGPAGSTDLVKHASFELDERDRVKLRDLRRTKSVATSVLVATVILLVVAKILEHRVHPGFGYLAAFAEAATIGGLADWYAVVVLFRRPLGLPIPHTAIIPANQQRIAQSLGEFIETHFLAPGPVEAKLKQVDFAAAAAEWLSDRERSAGFARFILRLLPETLNAVEQSGLREFAAQRVIAQIKAVELAPFAAGLLTTFTEDRRHQRILDEVLNLLNRLMTDPIALDAIRQKIRAELPTLLNLYRADKYVLNKLVASGYGFLKEVRADPDHPLRAEFDRFVTGFIEQLTTSPEYVAKIEALKEDVLAYPQLAELAQGMWDSFRHFLEQSVRDPKSMLHTHLQTMLMEAGRQLAEDARLRADINRGMTVVLLSFIQDNKSGVSAFIADQVKSWDMDQLIRLIEINIGRDLQYIRFNGAMIGGVAGLALYTAGIWLKLY